MAGGYRPTKTGSEGLAAELASLKRQVDALRQSAPMTSAQIQNGLFTVTDAVGDPIAQFGVIPTKVVDPITGTVTDDFLLGSRYFGPGQKLLFSVGTVLSSGVKVAQFGSSLDMSALPFFRIFASDVGINADNLNLNSTGTATINAAGGTFITHTTTGSAANARLETTGLLLRSTSSKRYKQDIEDVEIDVDAFLQLRARTWRDRNQVADDPDTTDRYIGFVAEEVEALGLPFVEYDDEGRPDALMYDRFMTGAVQVMRAQQKQLADQAGQIDALTKRLDALEANA